MDGSRGKRILAMTVAGSSKAIESDAENCQRTSRCTITANSIYLRNPNGYDFNKNSKSMVTNEHNFESIIIANNFQQSCGSLIEGVETCAETSMPDFLNVDNVQPTSEPSAHCDLIDKPRCYDSDKGLECATSEGKPNSEVEPDVELESPTERDEICAESSTIGFSEVHETKKYPITADYDFITNPDGYDSDKDPEFVLSPQSNGTSSSESEVISESEINTDGSKGRPKKGRKRKYLNLNRQDNKKARNSNDCHFDYKGRTIQKKTINHETFQCKCSRKCHTKIGADERREEFNKYWKLGSYDAQTALIGAMVNEEPKKRKYGQNIRSREFSRHYKLNKIEVCRETYISTLAISTKRVDTALKKLRNNSITDKRGRKQGGKNKIEEERRQEIIQQINGIPKYKSHYRREQNSEVHFLPPEMTLPLMYQKYKEEVQNPVSFASYRRIFFSDFNLKFKSLKKDTCQTCDTFEACFNAASNVTEKQKFLSEQDRHIKMWQNARQKMKEDMLKAKENELLECLTFDLEKTLPLPRLPTGILFYKRQLWLYNLGIHSGTNNKGYFYVWLENEAGRGAQEIGSCLSKHITEKVPSNIEELILWSDSCGGQNRNIKMTLMMKTILESHPSLQKIIMRFLVSGHSYLPNDSDFSDVECALKHQQRLYLPDDYIRVMEQCRKKNKFQVTRMSSSQFFTTSEIEKQLISNRKTDVNGEKISWIKSRELCLEKNKPFSIFLKEHFEDEFYVEINIRKRQVGRPNNKAFKDLLLPMWSDGKEISAPKLKDIKSIMHLIPQDCKNFYKNLQGRDGLEDDIDGFSGTPDFDLAEEN